MADELLRRFSNRVALPATELENDIDGDADDCGGFGWMRSARDKCLMLQLRKKNGNIVAIPYGWVERAEFDPSEGITLHVHGKIIRIRGRNLGVDTRPQVNLFQGICRNRVPWVLEAERAALMKAAESATVIEQIEW